MSSELRLLLQSFDGYWNCISLYINPKPLCLALSIFLYTIYSTFKTMTSLSVLYFPETFMLLGCHGRIWNRSRNVILNSVFLVPHFGLLDGFCMTIMRRFFYVAYTKKRQRHSVTDYFIHLVDFTHCFLFFVITVYLLRHSGSCCFVGIVDVFLRSKIV
jgi:hypothetical protein